MCGLFPKITPSLPFLRVTETITILSPLINVFEKDLNTNTYLVIIYEKTSHCSESKIIDVHFWVKTSLYHLLRHRFLGEACAENNKIIEVLEMIFLLFSNITCKTYRRTKYNIKNWGN